MLLQPTHCNLSALLIMEHLGAEEERLVVGGMPHSNDVS